MEEKDIIRIIHQFLERLTYYNCVIKGNGFEKAAWWAGLRLAEIIKGYYKQNNLETGNIMIRLDGRKAIQSIISMRIIDIVLADVAIPLIFKIPSVITYQMNSKNLILIAKDDFEGLDTFIESTDNVFDIQHVKSSHFKLILTSQGTEMGEVKLKPPKDCLVQLYKYKKQKTIEKNLLTQLKKMTIN